VELAIFTATKLGTARLTNKQIFRIFHPFNSSIKQRAEIDFYSDSAVLLY